jgi:hypothetical protein
MSNEAELKKYYELVASMAIDQVGNPKNITPETFVSNLRMMADSIEKITMEKNTYFRLECGQEDRISREFGPFDFVQFTYSNLRVELNNDTVIAAYHAADGEWRLNEEFLDILGIDKELANQWYSDIIIYDGGIS